MKLTPLKNSDSIFQITNRINELIEKSNHDKDLLDSFRNVPEEDVNLSFSGLNIHNQTIIITVSGTYKVELFNTTKGYLRIIRNENKFLQETIITLDKDNTIAEDIFLLNGDTLELKDQTLNIETEVKISLQRNFIKVINDYFVELKEFADELLNNNEIGAGLVEDLEVLKVSYQQALNALNLISDTFVTKVQGKGLSTNDYDNEAQTKVQNIPSNPKYTDTVYTHPVTAGNKHVPSGGGSGKILVYGGNDGTAIWGDAPVTTTVVDSLDSNSSTSALSANKGKELNENKLNKAGGTMTGKLTSASVTPGELATRNIKIVNSTPSNANGLNIGDIIFVRS